MHFWGSADIVSYLPIKHLAHVENKFAGWKFSVEKAQAAEPLLQLQPRTICNGRGAQEEVVSTDDVREKNNLQIAGVGLRKSSGVIFQVFCGFFRLKLARMPLLRDVGSRACGVGFGRPPSPLLSSCPAST